MSNNSQTPHKPNGAPAQAAAAAAAAATLDLSRRSQTINLGAGPSALPTDVLLQAAQGILDYQQTGMGLVELSHRSTSFQSLIDAAERDLRELLDVPPEYAVIFTQGGGTEQFSATALNLLARHAIKNPEYRRRHPEGPPCDYVVTGSWSAKALKEGKRLGANARAAADAREVEGAGGRFGRIPPVSAWRLSDASSVETRPAFLYYCDNETVDGVEFPSPGFPLDELPREYRDEVPIVADCSSNILSRPVDVRRHAVVFFGAQKNVGPAGVTVVIARRDLFAADPDQGVPFGGPRIPLTLSYKTAAENGSLYNTPPMFAIYVSALVFSDLLRNKGGVRGAEARAEQKSRRIYSVLEASDGVYAPTVPQRDARSRMNVTFRVCAPTAAPSSSGVGGQPDAATLPTADESLEARFVARCAEAGIRQVKGHRSVGGIRASLYNAVGLQETEALAQVLLRFADEVRAERGLLGGQAASGEAGSGAVKAEAKAATPATAPAAVAVAAAAPAAAAAAAAK